MLSRPSRSSFAGDEPGFEVLGGLQHKQRTLNTRLSFGNSAETVACSTGPYSSYWAEAGTKNELSTYFAPDQKKYSKNESSRFEPRISFIQGVQVHPYLWSLDQVGG